jgi:hypothetical protein
MSPDPMDAERAFPLAGVVHLVRPTGARARDLDELRACIAGAPARSLFCHTLQCQLRDPSSAELPPDDFTAWVNGVLQERETAERLSLAVQLQAASVEELRGALLAVLEALPEKRRAARTAAEGGELVLLTAESVRVPTGLAVRDGTELMEALASADVSVWFHHVYEEPWLREGGAPLGEWLAARGEGRLAGWLDESPSWGLPVEAARRRVLRRWRGLRLRRSVAAAAATPEGERRDAARAAVANLVRRVTGTERSG